MQNYSKLYALWLERAQDPAIRAELESIRGDEDAILDRFYKDLEFGTGGLRGVIGAGTNRMNIYTVSRATQGFANYLCGVKPGASVAIAYDSRINSTLFARTAACVFAANGIRVHLFPELAPTPLLSFAVRELGCDGGVVITASHNPSKYNGYKAYGPDGCQLGLDASERVIREVERVDLFADVKTVDFDEALASSRIAYIDHALIERYLDRVQAQSVRPDAVRSADLSVIYTPLNGTGNKPVRAMMSRIGVSKVTVVPEQVQPDGNFPTAPYPNPEIREAFTCALRLAETECPDLLIATDPDCDRVGIAVRGQDGEYTLMTGNEVGALMLHYILEGRTAAGTLPARPVAVKTIVSTAICDKIAAKYGCEIIDVLTGFKFIGEQIGLLERTGEENRFIFGFEESYGYLAGSYVRDKDAVFASMMICEMAAYYQRQGKTLLDEMDALYAEFGVYLHTQLNIAFEGAEGMEKMKQIMSNLRETAPSEIAGLRVERVSDYLRSETVDCKTGARTALTLPKSDVLSYALEGGAGVIIRPSGTEPKIKVYLTAIADNESSAQTLEQRLCDGVRQSFGF